MLIAFVSLSVVGCDQLSKEVARSTIEPREVSLPGGGEFELRVVENRGGFLSVGEDLPEQLRRTIFRWSAPALLLITLLSLVNGANRVQAAGLGLILGGGVGNWLDRLAIDASVTDFMRLGIGNLSTGIFNLADVALVGGATLLLFAQVRGGDEHPTAPHSKEPADKGREDA